jgi:carbamoyl-phosphate synthase small subunit
MTNPSSQGRVSTRANEPSNVQPKDATGVLVLADGSVFWGRGLGAEGTAMGELCFNTSMTGYQEITTDPSYAGQIITFTFPHIGNTGINMQDIETQKPSVRGVVLREQITTPSSWRAAGHLEDWLDRSNLIGLSGVDTRALTIRIRDSGAPNAVISHDRNGKFDLEALKAKARQWPGLEGMDLAKDVTCARSYEWNESVWKWYPQKHAAYGKPVAGRYHVIAVDYGAKHNILRCLVNEGCRVTVVPATATAEEILALKPDGVFLSNGPGDPAATGVYAVRVIKALLEREIPLFGICLGHQILALALGAKTAKMPLGHRGANHPVKDLQTGKVDITSQNHGFHVLPDTLPDSAEVTHVSLFDGTNEGLRLKDKPAFSIQYHPEASPGPHDSHHHFKRFVDMIEQHKASRKAA